jgi:hypothetical protein
MSRGTSRAGGTGVPKGKRTAAVRPAVLWEDRCSAARCGGCGPGQIGGGCKGGAVVTSLFGRQLALTFKIGYFKVGLDVGKRAIRFRAKSPELDGVQEYTGVFELVKCGLHGVHVGDGVAGLCNLATLDDVGPQGFEWLGAGPVPLKIFAVGGEIVGGDGAVFRLEVVEHVEYGELREMAGWVADFLLIKRWNGLDELALEVAIDVVVDGVLFWLARNLLLILSTNK